ncbi:MAG: helix-turn-helix transcriptional regulator, partial [Bryobacteraceae bacterium]
QWSGSVLELNQGSLYPALYRLEQQGFVSSSWRITAHNRRARYYTLTAAGRRSLGAEQKAWARMSQAVNLVLAVKTA